MNLDDLVEQLRDPLKAGLLVTAKTRSLFVVAADEIESLRFALRGLHDDNADYQRINHLGGYDNHWMRAARLALAGLPEGATVGQVK